jgi:RNA polymerase sigma-54 factor
MIDAEDPSNPYSDQEIAELLLSDGVAIARRTVAKYRDELKILPARLRHR